MVRTAIASAIVALLAYAAAYWLTHDFQIWTAEDARRMEIAMRPVTAPPVSMDGPGIHDQSIAALLSDGGTPTIVDFIYTRCVSVCTTLGTVFQQMQASIIQERDRPDAVNVRLMSISFDPDRDDADALAAYASRLRADPGIWRFARAANAADTRTLLDRYQVTVIADGQGGYEHNAALLVIDRKGRLIRVFDYAEMETALAFARSRPTRGDSR